MVFCGCCDNSVFDVLDNMSNHINKPNLPTGVRDILLMIEIDGEYCSFKKLSLTLCAKSFTSAFLFRKYLLFT